MRVAPAGSSPSLASQPDDIIAWDCMLSSPSSPSLSSLCLHIDGHEILYDAADHHLVSQYHWRVCRYGKLFYAVAGSNILMHRRLLNPPKHAKIDHKNHNGIDNRRENIRVANDSENACNRLKHKPSKSGSKYKGVRKVSRVTGCKWVAVIRHKGIVAHLGTFATELEAVTAYNQAARRFHGNFASLNEVG